MSNVKEKIEELLSDPLLLLKKKPFWRGTSTNTIPRIYTKDIELNDTIEAQLPYLRKCIVPQDKFIQELDPDSHDVLFDDNIPQITMKVNKGYVEVKYKKMALPIQRLIRDKHVLHLCGNDTIFTLLNTDPTDKQTNDFILFKQMWMERNMDGMRTKMISTQKSLGDAGLLFYYDYKGRCKARLISYEDGYVICSHNDDNGDRILESIFYHSGDSDYIDSYDDTYMYRYVRTINSDSVYDNTWQMMPPVKHGFSEIPLVTKRGKVAWDSVQNLIEVYEVIYNIFLVIMKRHGWGILYVKGQFADEGKKIAGAIVLNDRSLDGNGSAEFKQAPSPDGMLQALESLEEAIQKGSGCTIILPKDISLSGDISGVAVEISQSLDNETALQGAIEWQNAISKMQRLAQEGFAKELVATGEKEFATAVTDFQNLKIAAKLKPWKPRSETEYNNMLIALKGSGGISEDTLIEKNTESSPDEKVRRKKEKEEALRLQEKQLALQYGNKNGDGGSNTNGDGSNTSNKNSNNQNK